MRTLTIEQGVELGVKVISNQLFPIFVASFLLFRFDKSFKELSRVLGRIEAKLGDEKQ